MDGLPRFVGILRKDAHGIQPYADAVLLIPLEEYHINDRADAQADRTQQIKQAGAAHVHHYNADAQQQDGAGKVRLKENQAAGNAQYQDKGQVPGQEGLHLLVVQGYQMRKQKDQGKLGDLGGLELEAGQPDPAVDAVGGGQEQHHHQHSQGYQHQRDGKMVEDVVINRRNKQHRRHAEERKNQLPLDKVKAVPVVPVIGIGIPGGKLADQPHHQDNHQDDQKGHVKALGDGEKAKSLFRFGGSGRERRGFG